MAAALSTGLESAANDLVTSVERVMEKNRSSGMDPGRADSVLQNAREAIKDRRFVEAIEYKKVIEDILEDARRQKDSRRIRDNLAELRAKLEAHAKLGADVRMASELLARAEALVDAGEYADVDGYAKRISDEIDAARQSIEGGDVDGFHRGLADARAAIEETRTKHFIEKYETRVHSVSTMIANAKKLGAELGDAENSLNQAEAALRGSDMAMADILIKQAEVSIGMQIQNFIKNRYPNLALRVQSAGLQVGEWNQYTFEIENRGKLPARNVQVELSGDLEAKGVMPIAEIGVGEVMPLPGGDEAPRLRRFENPDRTVAAHVPGHGRLRPGAEAAPAVHAPGPEGGGGPVRDRPREVDGPAPPTRRDRRRDQEARARREGPVRGHRGARGQPDHAHGEGDRSPRHNRGDRSERAHGEGAVHAGDGHPARLAVHREGAGSGPAGPGTAEGPHGRHPRGGPRHGDGDEERRRRHEPGGAPPSGGGGSVPRGQVRTRAGDPARPARTLGTLERRDRWQEGGGRARLLDQRHPDREEPGPRRPRGGVVPDEDRGSDPEEEPPPDGGLPPAGEGVPRPATAQHGPRQGPREPREAAGDGLASEGGPRGPRRRRSLVGEGRGRVPPGGPSGSGRPDRTGRGEREGAHRSDPEGPQSPAVPRDDEPRTPGEPLDPDGHADHEQGELARGARDADREWPRGNPRSEGDRATRAEREGGPRVRPEAEGGRDDGPGLRGPLREAP